MRLLPVVILRRALELLLVWRHLEVLLVRAVSSVLFIVVGLGLFRGFFLPFGALLLFGGFFGFGCFLATAARVDIGGYGDVWILFLFLIEILSALPSIKLRKRRFKYIHLRRSQFTEVFAH